MAYDAEPGVYQSWHDCSRNVLGVQGAMYKRYNNFHHALREFQAFMADVNPIVAAPPPQAVQPMPHEALPQIMPPEDGDGKGGWWKKVLITSLVILVVGLCLKGAKDGKYDSPT